MAVDTRHMVDVLNHVVKAYCEDKDIEPARRADDLVRYAPTTDALEIPLSRKRRFITVMLDGDFIRAIGDDIAKPGRQATRLLDMVTYEIDAALEQLDIYEFWKILERMERVDLVKNEVDEYGRPLPSRHERCERLACIFQGLADHYMKRAAETK